MFSNVFWVLANITFESSHCFQKGNKNLGSRLCIMVCSSFWEDYYMLIHTHCWELKNLVGSHGNLSLPFVMKVMVYHFVNNFHEVMTALIIVLPLIVVVEISLQLHWSRLLCLVKCLFGNLLKPSLWCFLMIFVGDGETVFNSTILDVACEGWTFNFIRSFCNLFYLTNLQIFMIFFKS